MKGQYFGQLCAVKSWSFDKSSYACKGWIEYFLYGTLCVGGGAALWDILMMEWLVWHSQGGGSVWSAVLTPAPLSSSLLQFSHPGLDLTHGDVVDWGLLPPGTLGDHHLEEQQQWDVWWTDWPLSRLYSLRFGYWLYDEFFSGLTFWHTETS